MSVPLKQVVSLKPCYLPSTCLHFNQPTGRPRQCDNYRAAATNYFLVRLSEYITEFLAQYDILPLEGDSSVCLAWMRSINYGPRGVLAASARESFDGFLAAPVCVFERASRNLPLCVSLSLRAPLA